MPNLLLATVKAPVYFKVRLFLILYGYNITKSLSETRVRAKVVGRSLKLALYFTKIYAHVKRIKHILYQYNVITIIRRTDIAMSQSAPTFFTHYL